MLKKLLKRGGQPLSTVSDDVADALPRPALQAAASAVRASTTVADSLAAWQLAPAVPLHRPRDFTPPGGTARRPFSPWSRLTGLLHSYSLTAFALLFLAVGVAAIKVGGNYWTTQILNKEKPAATTKPLKPTIAGLNLTVPASQLQAKLQTITGQPAGLTVGSTTVPISASTIRSWLQITSSKDKSEDYIRIKAGSMADSLNQLAKQFVKAPVNQVTVTSGSTSVVVVTGRNGTALSDPGTLKTQADQVAKTVMDGRSLQFNTPLVTVPFQAVTPAAFNKLLVADVTTKQLAAFQNGQQVNSFLVSAGAPATPTPIGEFHIYAKLTSQTMTGYNTNGTRYVQPNVPWVNYFTAGDAVHGNYWRSASVFGNVNTSHGCVGVPVNQAEWIYNWAPLGTTVIVTNNPSLTFVNS
jgi:lipoprotein-anchoring transpeptidase ErfK/SrfK